MIKKNTLLILSIFIASFTYSQSYNIEGDWYTENNDAIIKIYKEGNTLSGKITWMKTPNDENGNPKTDPENPDEKLKSRKRLGMIMMYNFSYDEDDQWDDGEIYDPESGNTYSGIITMTSKNKLDLRGYVGISWFGRTSQWTRKTN
ncbi:MAG: DUF2147 domain-containing protein [Flavobacteriales bacterium]